MANLGAGESAMNVTDSGKLAAMPNRSRAVGAAIERMADNTPLRFSLAAVLVLQALVVMTFRPSYETGDDVFLTMIAAGKGICPAPDEHLVFTNVMIGQALKRLYTAFPGFPWYGCYLFAVHYAAQVAMLYCALVVGRTPAGAHRRPVPAAGGASLFARLVGWGWAVSPPGQVRLRCGLYLLYFCLVELPLLNRFQYTTTAFLSSQAGIFLVLLAWQRRARQADAVVIGPLLAAVALLVVGGMIRLESLAMALLVASPVALLLVCQFSRRALLPCGLAVASAAVLVAAAVAYDHGAYEHDPRWAGFRSLNQLRGQFHDGRWTSYTPQTAHLFSQVGWSENDHAMIANWFSDDPVLYDRANLTRILESYPWQAAHRTAGLWWDAFRSIARNRSVLSVLLALPFVLAVVAGGRRGRWAIAASALAALALTVFVIWNKKVPPERVFFPLLSFPLSVALLSFAWRSGTTSSGDVHDPADGNGESGHAPLAWQPRRQPTRVVVVLLVVALVMGVYRQCRQSVLVHWGRGELQSFRDDLRPADHKLYVSWEAGLPYQFVSPLDSLESWRIPLLSIAWTQRTPFHEEVKRQFGISSIAQAMCQRDDIVVVAPPLHRELFATFAKEHFQSEVEFVPLKQYGERFVPGHFRPMAQIGDATDERTLGTRR